MGYYRQLKSRHAFSPVRAFLAALAMLAAAALTFR
jgi:hypothetical protein